VDKALFLGEVPTVWLQERLVGPRIAWWEAIPTLVYVSHFFVTLALGIWLYLRARAQWLPFLWRFCALNAAGLVTFVLLPTAPPWWADERGVIDGAERVLGRGWSILGLKSAGALVSVGQDRANEVAAIPSLHTGWAVLACLFLWPTARRARPLLVLYPFLMGFSLVYGGEHYVVDLIVGAAFAWGAHAAVGRISRLRIATTDNR
jgi:membrane-associated phospholipid phosphatase